jgi:hypothetical protein
MTPELTDSELLERFESALLPNHAFKHREHLRAAFAILLRSEDLAEGALRFRRALKRFAHAHGANQKYNETLTWAFLVLIQERMHTAQFATSQQFLAAYPELLNYRGGMVERYYNLDAVLASPVARRLFLLPGSEPLERR